MAGRQAPDEQPLADEFAALVQAIDTTGKLKLDPAVRSRFSFLYRRLSEIDEREQSRPRRR